MIYVKPEDATAETLLMLLEPDVKYPVCEGMYIRRALAFEEHGSMNEDVGHLAFLLDSDGDQLVEIPVIGKGGKPRTILDLMIDYERSIDPRRIREAGFTKLDGVYRSSVGSWAIRRVGGSEFKPEFDIEHTRIHYNGGSFGLNGIDEVYVLYEPETKGENGKPDDRPVSEGSREEAEE